MKTPNKITKQILIGAGILFIALLLLDRYYWAQISQWREDQATNIWLGYTAGVLNIPVGLISSVEIPNPNGMVILGFFLSALPNLLSVGFFLGILQIIFIFLTGWISFRDKWQYLLLAIIPSFTSVLLRSTSVEFWNQYTISLINIFFIFLSVKYLEKPSLWSLPPITILILMAPSLYLAGLVNAMVMTLLTLGLFAYNPPGTKGVMVVLPVTALLIAISISLTWNPYFQNVMLEQISNYSESRLGIVGMFRAAWEALFSFPIYATFQWVDNSTFTSAIKHADPGILSLKTLFVLRLTGRAYLLQAVFAFAISCSLILISFWKGVSAKGFDLKINYSVAKIIVLSTLFIGLSYTFSAWLGGPAWIKGERPDQLIQFLPMLLFLIFLLPFLFINNGRSGKIISGISFSLLVIFGMINLISGFMIIHDHLQYRGNILTKADVPLIDKMQAIEFIANNWQEHSDSNIIPVDYDLGGGTWDWVADFGLKMEPWYPAPMTDGRGFDYEFLRSYGLTNYQEGIQLRTFGTGRFLITYAFKDPPQVGEQIDHYFFGRLRVSVVER